MDMNRPAAIWFAALEEALYCVPSEMREEVLTELLDKERHREPFKLIKVSDIDPREFKNANAENEAISLIIQVLVRSITNSHSSEGAAQVLFREHRNGAGGRWLPEYLDGLPGLQVDLKKCAAIAKSAGKSKLPAPEQEKHNA